MKSTGEQTTDTRKRLAAISHHFLSGPMPRSAKPGKPTLVLPVLPVGTDAAFPFSQLSATVRSKGRSAHVLSFDSVRRDASPSASATHPNPSIPSAGTDGGDGPAFQEQVAEALSGVSPVPDLCLVPLDRNEWPVAAALGNALLTVQANRASALAAYALIKRMAAAGMQGIFGVTIVGAENAGEAGRYFDVLADAADHFLGLEVVSYGYLPAPPPAHAPVDLLADEGSRSPRIIAIDGIATLLIGDLPEPPATTGVTVKNPAPEKGA